MSGTARRPRRTPPPGGGSPGVNRNAIGGDPAPPGAHETAMGFGPDPDQQMPPEPGSNPALRETVIVAEPPAMSDQEFQAAWVNLRQTARNYADRLSYKRADALRLYNGIAMGDEEVGRSQVVLTEVKDTIAAVMPTVMRIFAGTERPVEFAPQQDGDEEKAKQATDYVQHVVFVECDGFRAIHDAALDAFQLKAGWIRWWWDTAIDVKTEHYYGLLEPQCAALVTESGVRAMKVIRRPATPDERMGLAASQGEAQVVQPMPGVPLLVYDVTLTRRVPRNRPRVEAVASERVWIDPDASGPHDARGLFIVRTVIVSDLVALGFDEKEILSRADQVQPAMNNRVARVRDYLGASSSRVSSPDPALRQITYTEGWIRVDYDGDGIAELRRVQAIGTNGQEIIAQEGASHIPVARITPFFVPHRAIGESYADRVGDLQQINSRVMRNILDSMSESIHPRTVIKDSAVSVDDVMNTEMGAVIRERETGAVRELTKPFIGPQALPILEVLAGIKEARTGVTRASQGLTAEALQSTTAIAVSAQVAASQDRLELVMRCIAEGLRGLYSGVLALMCERQDRARMVRLRGKWTPVDPRAWMAGFDVIVNTAVGAGTLAERLQVFASIAGKQEQILQTLGPSNPLVTLGQYRNTLADMMNTSGIANVERYFQDVPINYQPPPPPPPTPTPTDQLLAQVELNKTQTAAAVQMDGNTLKRQELMLEDDRQRDEARVDALLKAAEMRARYGVHIDLADLSALMDRDVELTASILGARTNAGAIGNLLPPGTLPMAQGGPALSPAIGGLPGAGPPPGPPAPAGAPPGGAAPPPGGLAAHPAGMFLPPQMITALAAMRRAAGPAQAQFAPPTPVPASLPPAR